MKIDIISEPELEFGAGGRHIDIRFGLMNYGPLDVALPTAPTSMRLGIVGTPESVEGFCSWIERCRNGVNAKASNQPNLFPRFPGFGRGELLHAEIVTDGSTQRSVSDKELSKICKNTDDNMVVREGAERFLEELRGLSEKGAPDVLVCAVPQALLKRMWSRKKEPVAGTARDGDAPAKQPLMNFHDLLKARAMSLGRPLQLIVPSTYDETKRLRQVRRDVARKTQDEATRAWNLYVALYYKSGGVPWRLVRDAAQLTVCYVGVSFYETLDAGALFTSTAQVFNERGEGIVLRGEAATVSKDDRQPHLDETKAKQLLLRALQAYRSEHKTFPARVVVYKTSNYSEGERAGFTAALEELNIGAADLMNLGDIRTRLFRDGEYPPLRGTLLSKDDRRHTLYTRGSVDFYETYPGMYVPHPLGMTLEEVEQTPRFLAQELLALSKLNWNNTQFDNSEPIVVTAARKVGKILKYLPGNETPQTRYSFYM